MNTIDLEMYKTFCKNFDYDDWGEDYIRNHPPRLEDIFQIAKERGYDVEIRLSYGISEHYLHLRNLESKLSVPYSPCDSLLNQPDQIKEILYKFFR